MANYINTEILSEAYTHLDIELYNDKARLEQLRHDLEGFFRDRASFLFGGDVDIKVVFEEGSLRTKVIAVGSAVTILTAAISSYGSFRQGVTQLASDAGILAQSANMEVVFRTKTPLCDRLRIEKRKGVFGRVSALISGIDSLALRIEDSRLPTTKNQAKLVDDLINSMISWHQESDRLFTKLENKETISCVAQGLQEEIYRLPKSLPWEGALSSNSLRATLANSDPAIAGEIAALAARYSATIRSIHKNLGSHVIPNKQS